MSSLSPPACADAIRAILAQPELTSAATAIWAPLDAPDALDASLGAIALLQERLAVHDALVAQVRANILALARRECVRILHVVAAEDAADQAAAGAAGGPAAERAEQGRTHATKANRPLSHQRHPNSIPQQARHPLAAADRTAMIANLDLALSEPTASDPLPQPDLSKLIAQAPPHEVTARKLMRVISNTIAELRLYNGHAAQHRAAHEQALKYEMDKAAQPAYDARSP